MLKSLSTQAQRVETQEKKVGNTCTHACWGRLSRVGKEKQRQHPSWFSRERGKAEGESVICAGSVRAISNGTSVAESVY